MHWKSISVPIKKTSDFDVDTQPLKSELGTTASFRNGSEHILGVKAFRRDFDLMTAFWGKQTNKTNKHTHKQKAY